MGSLVFLVVYGGLCLLVAYAGRNRKITFWGAFILSLVVGPFIGIIVTLITKKKEVVQEQPKLEEFGQPDVEVRSNSEKQEMLDQWLQEGKISIAEYKQAKRNL